MAYSFVQSVEGSRVTSGSTISATYTTQNVGAGNLLVAVVSVAVASGTALTIGQVSDNQGNYWKQAVEGAGLFAAAGGPQGVDIWYCESAGGGNKPAVTATALAFPNNTINGMNILLLEYTGNSGHELVDQIGQASTTTTSVTVTTNYNLNASNDLCISAVTGTQSAATIPSGFASRVADTTQKFWVADNVSTGSSGSTLSAAWTAMTGNTKGCGIMVCFKSAGATTGPTLLQSCYTDAAYPVATPLTSWTSQAYPVNPKAGNTLIALVSGIAQHPPMSLSATGCTGIAGDTWTKIIESGVDMTSNVDLTLFYCSNTVGGGPYTITVTFPFPSAGFSCLLLEFSGFTKPSVVDSANGIAGGGVSTAWSISTTGNVLAGDIAVASLSSLLTGPTAAANGWTQINSDTAGVGWACMQVATAAGPLTSSWTGGPFVATDMVIGALRPAPGIGTH